MVDYLTLANRIFPLLFVKQKRSNIILSILSAAMAYMFAEGVYSLLVVSNIIEQKTIWFIEETDPKGNFQFDPLIGYRISKKPSRFGAVTSAGSLESLGILQGNDVGLPDTRDFLSGNTDSSVCRIGVLGDSFTASQFRSRSWLKCFEDSLNRVYQDSIQLLNLACDGGGLANWCEILDHIIVQNNLELDAIVYAVLGSDLDRTFHYRHHYAKTRFPFDSIHGSVGFSYHENWLPMTYPDSVPDPETMFYVDCFKTLNTVEVNQIEGGQWKVQKPLDFYFYLRLRSLFDNLLSTLFTKALAEPSCVFSEDKKNLINQMKILHKELNIPVLVFSLEPDDSDVQFHQAFANILEAEYLRDKKIKGRDFRKEYRIEGDGHWTSKGAEFFARENHARFANWMKSKGLIEK